MLYCSHRPKRCRTTLIFRVPTLLSQLNLDSLPTPLSRLPYGSSKLQGVRFVQVRGSEVFKQQIEHIKNLSSSRDERFIRGTTRIFSISERGGPEGARTPDLIHAMDALFQLRYRPI